MSVSTPWTNSTPGSTARNNKVTVISDTGDNLGSYDIALHRVVFCTEDGGEFVKDHLYTANADEDAWIDVTIAPEHTHFDSDDGGSFTEIFMANPKSTILQLTDTVDVLKANWIQTVTGTGSIEDQTVGERYTRLRPNGTSGSGATISYPHLECNFAARSMYQTKLKIETATSIALHTGVGADDITAADSNTIKYQAEVCTVTNNNWWIRTADGAANSASDSGTAITANEVSVRMLHRPDNPEVALYIDGTSVFQKTTNIPITGVTASDNIVKHSVKNSTAADRPLRVYGTRLTYKTSTGWE